MQMKANVETTEFDVANGRYQHLEWCMGLRACVLHWEREHGDGKLLTKVPMEIIQRGEASVKRYISDATTSNPDEVVYRCKVCVVGPSEWGKTSLVRSIETMKPFLMDIKDRTIGIELVSVALSGSINVLVDDVMNAKVVEPPSRYQAIEDDSSVAGTVATSSRRHHEVTFWDFAGQDVYQVAHSLFFSRRTVYILVVDVDAYSKQLDAVESLKPTLADAAMDRFLSRYVFRWVRTIFSHQVDAEFLVLGTKADLLENEEEQSERVWRDLQTRIYMWKLDYMRELEAEYSIVTAASGKFTGKRVTVEKSSQGSATLRHIEELTEKLARLASDRWLVVSVTRSDSIEAVRQALEQSIDASERGFPMWTKYSRVLQAIAAKRTKANRPDDGLRRLENGIIPVPALCRHLLKEVNGLEYDDCIEILRTLHDLGDIIWYEHHAASPLRNYIILDPMLVIDIVREVISHERTNKTAVDNSNQSEAEENSRIDGRVNHSLLKTFSLWKHMDTELMLSFKMLLKEFQLAYPADDGVMDPDSDLIVPSYWNVQLEGASLMSGEFLASDRRKTDTAAPYHHCWEYEASADLSAAIFERFAVQSYTSFMQRTVRGNCIESSCAEFQSWISLHTGATKHDVIRVEVASVDAELSWLNMKYYLMKLEKVLDVYGGLGVQRYVVVDGERHSLGRATKAVLDSHKMGWDVNKLRNEMPWIPPDLDWYNNRAWRGYGAMKELQMMHLVRDKIDVLQKLVVQGDSKRRYPALWSLEFDPEKRVAVLRMLSDLSGKCHHLPLEIAVPPAFLAQYGSMMKAGVSILSNVVSSTLSVPILRTAIEGTVPHLEAKTNAATAIHNLIERLDLSTTTGKAVKASKESGLSPGSTMALLRDLLMLYNDSLDELSITEICQLECAATSQGDYVWAHADEIRLLKKELQPCDPRMEPTVKPSRWAAAEQQVPHSSHSDSLKTSNQMSKPRLSFCIDTVEGLADWDWYKTYCTWQLLFGASQTPIASGATSTNADSSILPSWPSLTMSLDPVDTVEMLQECRLVVQVKRRSRIGWTKLIGTGQVELRSFVSVDGKLAFNYDPFEVPLLTSDGLASQRVVRCKIVRCE